MADTETKVTETQVRNELVMLGYVANLLGLPVKLGADAKQIPPTKKQAVDFLTRYIAKHEGSMSQTLKDLVERARKG